MGLCDWANDLTNSNVSPWMLSTNQRGGEKKSDHGKNLGMLQRHGTICN